MESDEAFLASECRSRRTGNHGRVLAARDVSSADRDRLIHFSLDRVPRPRLGKHWHKLSLAVPMRCLLRPLVLVALLAGIALPVLSWAIDLFVAKGGANGGNDCTDRTRPCASVGRALRVAVSGDTIEIALGRYRESLSIDSSTTLTVRGGWDQSFSTRDPARSR